MDCLLCHEKIPRLRAWTGKSEFCCDDHAELYKKQTMDRLLVDDSQSLDAAPVLPIFDDSAASVDHVLLKAPPQEATQEKKQEKKQEKVPKEANEVDELWKLAESMGGAQNEPPAHLLLQGVSSESQDDVQTHSAEEALSALQALAAETKPDSPAGGDLLDEFSSMESSLERLPPLDSLPIDLAARIGLGERDEAPELEPDPLEPLEAEAEIRTAPKPIAQASAGDAIDAADLLLEGLLEAQQEALELPELPADFDAEQEESLEPPEAVLEERLAAPDASDEQSSERSDPPEPDDLDLVDAVEASPARPAAAPVARRAHKAAPKLRPATQLQEMTLRPNAPEGGSALKPWTDALAIAGPDRSQLLSPANFMEMRKASLNGTASATFDPVQFQATDRIAAVPVPISEPTGPTASYGSQNDALTPASAFAWPAPFHAAWIAAEMRLNATAEGVSLGESFFSVTQPVLSAEFLSRVALKSRILEPACSTILSPPERDAFASPSAEEEESGSEYASAAGRSDRDKTDGGERAHVADLF